MQACGDREKTRARRKTQLFACAHAKRRRSARIDNHVDQTKRVRTAIRASTCLCISTSDEPAGLSMWQHSVRRIGASHPTCLQRRDISVHRLRPIIDMNVHARERPNVTRHRRRRWIHRFTEESWRWCSRSHGWSSSCSAAAQRVVAGTLDKFRKCSEADSVYREQAWRGCRGKVSRGCACGSVFMGAGYYNVHAARLQDAGGAARAAQTAPAPEAATAAEQRALLDKYCVTCHNQRAKTAGLMLDSVDIEHLGEAPETWEKVAHMLRTGSMPPTGRPRPEPAARPPGDVSRRRPRPRGRGGAQRRADPAASPEPYRIRQRRPRSAGARHRRRRCCRATTPCSGSTTSPARSRCRRCCSNATWRSPPGQPPRRR